MNRIVVMAVFLCIPLFQACTIQLVTVHDGLKTIVVDAQSGTPVDDAGVYAFGPVFEAKLIATSNKDGAVLFDPKRRPSVMPLMGEALIELQLWVCKDGYEPQRVAARGGWNADFGVETYKLTLVRLKPDNDAPSGSCQSRVYDRATH
jgi:hypothetical protein